MVVRAHSIVVVLEAQCGCIEQFLFLVFVQLDVTLLTQVELHGEFDRNMLSQTFLCFDTRLDAVNSAPLTTSSPLRHHLTEQFLLDDADVGAAQVVFSSWTTLTGLLCEQGVKPN